MQYILGMLVNIFEADLHLQRLTFLLHCYAIVFEVYYILDPLMHFKKTFSYFNLYFTYKKIIACIYFLIENIRIFIFIFVSCAILF